MYGPPFRIKYSHTGTRTVSTFRILYTKKYRVTFKPEIIPEFISSQKKIITA